MTPVVLDADLLAPGRAGTAAHSATGDTPFLPRAMLDADAAPTRAQVTVGQTPGRAATAVTAAAAASHFGIHAPAPHTRRGGNPVIPLVTGLTAAAGETYGPYADLLAEVPEPAGTAIADLTDHFAQYTDSAGALTDRAPERR